MKLIALGGVVLLLLAVAKGLAPRFFFFLPLGGSSIAEAGIVYGIAIAAATIADLGGQG